MNTCGTCKYFGLKTGPSKGEQFESCGRVYMLCGRIQQEFQVLPNGEHAPDIAVVIDGSGYFAALCVTDDFGCNQWESK